ncbi:hypothetical protein [Enterocloster alcoholdehydrogenati]|uniref:hypothetical protein n=1 Tax=Enterocloster alcoholdehydrogenati TaxID=2547410 RepID=UPI001592BEAC|nr:hypothetical protein [Enterocloster alcoholdehydrogenati]
MVKSDLINLTQRQFTDVMEREAIEIEDYYTHEKYKVIFRKSSRGAKSNDSVIIFYPQNTNIQKGTMFLLKGEKYLVMTKDALESDVYFTSGAFRCNANVIVYEGSTANGTRNAAWYHEVPFVVNTLSGVNPSGSFIEIVNGNLSMHTSQQDFLDNVEINNEILDFGGRYEIVNNFFLDGIHNLYLKKNQINSNDKYVGILYVNDLYVGQEIPLHSIIVNTENYNSYKKDFGNEEYTVSNDAAQIKDGVLTAMKEGTFTITLKNPIGGRDYTSPVITVGNKKPDPPDPEEPVITWEISDDFVSGDTLYYSPEAFGYNDYNVTATPSEETDLVPSWKIFFDGEEYTDEDIVDYIRIDLSNPYIYHFTLINKNLVGYEIRIEAWVDGIKIGSTPDARVRQ